MATKPKQNYSAESQPLKDCWETPAVAYEGIRWWLDDLVKEEFTIWESAYGTGRSTGNLEKLGFYVESSPDSDFFTQHPDLVGLDPYDYPCTDRRLIQVTNPPYSKKYEWLERSYESGIPFALLLPADTMFAAKGMRLFAKYGVTVILPEHRIGFISPETGQVEDSPTMSTAWFLWHGNNDYLRERIQFAAGWGDCSYVTVPTVGYLTLPRFQYGKRKKQATDFDYFDFVNLMEPTEPSFF